MQKRKHSRLPSIAPLTSGLLTYLLTHQLLINFIKSVVAELTMGMLAISSDTDDSQDKEHISVFVLYKTKIANKYRHQLRGWTTIRYNTVD